MANWGILNMDWTVFDIEELFYFLRGNKIILASKRIYVKVIKEATLNIKWFRNVHIDRWKDK